MKLEIVQSTSFRASVHQEQVQLHFTMSLPQLLSPKGKRNTFYSVVDTIQASMKQRFVKNRSLLKLFALFAPCHIPDLLRGYKTVRMLFKPISRHFVQCTNWMRSDAQMGYLALQRHSASSIALK